MRCDDCMFYQPGEKTTFANFGMPKQERKCSMGVPLIYISGYGAIPGPPYNLPPNQVDYTFDTASVVQADVCPNFGPKGNYGNQGVQQSASSGNGCFLTSACVEALGKEDDCYELTTLREFRDKWLVKQKGGKSDIARYYAFAPSVVAQIDKLPNRIQLYEGIYRNLVSPCVSLIEEGQMSQAWALYREFSEALISEYAVGVA